MYQNSGNKNVNYNSLLPNKNAEFSGSGNVKIKGDVGKRSQLIGEEVENLQLMVK